MARPMSAEQRVIELLEVVRQKDEVIAQLKTENEMLREKVDALIRRVFGSSSEKMDAAQLELLLNLPKKDDELGKASGCAAAAPLAQPEANEPKRKKVRKTRMPDHLPVVEEVIVPPQVQANPQEWRRIGEEVSELLDFKPARFLKLRTVRPTYVKRHDPDADPITAPLPPGLQERCMAAPGLLAQIVVAKYCDHLPLYRQEQIYWTRHRVELQRQTMATWMGLVADWLKPIYQRIRTGVMGGGYVQVDETPIEYLEPGHGKTKQGYLWAVCKPGGDVCFHWYPSRAAACLEKIIPVNFSGVIQCDGYAAYPAFARERDITLAGCLAHARRGFHESLEYAPQQAGWVVYQIQHLYRIEKHLCRIKAGPKLREAVRAHQSRPILNRIHKALLRWKSKHRFLPQSAMGKAIEYALGQWQALSVYLSDGRVEIDNNSVENSIRPTALGKKNWLFIGSESVGDRGAILFTIIESCRRRGIDPFAYLRDVLTRLPHMTNWDLQKTDLTPQGWAMEQRQNQQATTRMAS